MGFSLPEALRTAMVLELVALVDKYGISSEEMKSNIYNQVSEFYMNPMLAGNFTCTLTVDVQYIIFGYTIYADDTVGCSYFPPENSNKVIREDMAQIIKRMKVRCALENIVSEWFEKLNLSFNALVEFYNQK